MTLVLSLSAAVLAVASAITLSQSSVLIGLTLVARGVVVGPGAVRVFRSS